MGFYEELLSALRASLEDDYEDTDVQMARAAGVHPSTVKKHVRMGGGQHIQAICSLADAAGLEIKRKKSAPAETTRDVCFVRADASFGKGITPPEKVAEDYLAVPMASEPVAAGPGLFPADEIQGWVLVWRHHPSVRFKHNLVAVEVGKGERSMLPLFSPGDILLIDKDDRDPQPPGKAMLICEPDGACAVKRVSVTKDDGDYSVTFYSDNAKEFPPRSYKLGRDYEGDISRAIAGRVVWAWSDVRDK